ncbi:MAG: hypothetical protein HYU66_02975 [Armatimonadetes bacterium]|nr:hypothetical protein [Armatimonadota bacterium]
MTIPIPRIAVPDCWLSNVDWVEQYLTTRLSRGRATVVGHSTHGRPVHLVEYPDDHTETRLMIVGGTHGHEPGTVASAINLLSLLEEGVDLDGREHPELLAALDRVHLFVVPLLNPDGRAVCPDTFHAQGVDTCTIYASGLQRDGSLVPYDADSLEPCYYFDPADAIFVGGQFNGAGWAINRRLSDEHSEAVEVQALLDAVRGLELEAVLDLHACGYNFLMQARSHPAPYWECAREWQRRAAPIFAGKGRQLGALNGDADPPRPPPFFFNSILFHRQAHLGWLAFEGRQGYLGRPGFMPLPSLWEIVDDYLTAVRVFLEVGADGWFARANRATFGAR